MDANKRRIVSFDIFDTLLIRNIIKPTDVFRLIGEVRHDFTFIYRRILAEKIARKINKTCTNIDDIYAFPILTKKEFELEVKIEEFILEKNPKIMDTYLNAIANTDSVFAISDMYLPSFFITKILNREGFSKLRKVYVSCEYGKEKADGSLFAHFLEENNYKAETVYHYGDNHIADIENARKIGINAIEIQRDENNLLKPLATGWERIIEGFINHRISNLEDEYERIGYEFLGLFVFLFNRFDRLPTKYKKKLDAFFASETLSARKIKSGSEKLIADIATSRWSQFIRNNSEKLAMRKIKYFLKNNCYCALVH